MERCFYLIKRGSHHAYVIKTCPLRLQNPFRRKTISCRDQSSSPCPGMHVPMLCWFIVSPFWGVETNREKYFLSCSCVLSVRMDAIFGPSLPNSDGHSARIVTHFNTSSFVPGPVWISLQNGGHSHGTIASCSWDQTGSCTPCGWWKLDQHVAPKPAAQTIAPEKENRRRCWLCSFSHWQRSFVQHQFQCLGRELITVERTHFFNCSHLFLLFFFLFSSISVTNEQKIIFVTEKFYPCLFTTENICYSPFLGAAHHVFNS